MRIDISDNQKKNFVIFLILSAAYFLLFIPVNLRSSQNANMLVCSGTDEYTQFPVLMKMISRDLNNQYSLLRLLDTDHYYYGYPFYFLSAVFTAPVKLYSMVFHGVETQVYILVLRQLSTVFTIFSLGMLISIWTEFKSSTAAVGMFLFFGFLPSIFINNTWWHPDSMLLFFVTATIYCLNRDRLRFQGFYILGAVFCGLAISTKIAGVFFFLTIPIYIIYARLKNQIRNVEIFRYALVFLGIMSLTIVLSYPILMFPGKILDILSTLRIQSQMISQEVVSFDLSRISDHYFSQLSRWFGFWPLYLSSITIGIFALVKDRERRLLNLIILSWSIPYLVYLLFFIERKYHYYFLPAIVPLFSMMWNTSVWKTALYKSKWLVSVLLTMLLSVQSLVFFSYDLDDYRTLLQETENCQALHFYREVISNNILAVDEEGQEEITRILHDPLIYFPPSDRIMEFIIWDDLQYDKIRQTKPDLIFLERRKSLQLVDQSEIELTDNDFPEQIVLFPFEYQKIMETDYGIVYQRKY